MTRNALRLTRITSITVATQRTVSFAITLVSPEITWVAVRTSDDITIHHGGSVYRICNLTVTSGTSVNANGTSGQK